MQLQDLRKEKGLTQQQLADLCDLSKFTISKLEQRLFRPSMDTLEKLRSVLGVSVNEIDWTPTREPKKRGRKRQEVKESNNG